VALLLILFLLFGVVLGGFGSGSSASSGSGQAQTVPAAKVPTVSGSYDRYAIGRLRAAGLVPVLRWCSAKSAEYSVERAAPREGTVVPRGIRVTLYLVPALGSGVGHPACSHFTATRPSTATVPVVKCSKRMSTDQRPGPKCGPPPANP